MSKQRIQLEAKVLGVIYAAPSGWCVIKTTAGVMTGALNEGDRKCKDNFIFIGEYSTHPKYGNQFKFYEYVRADSKLTTGDVVEFIIPYSSLGRSELTERITDIGGVEKVIMLLERNVQGQTINPTLLGDLGILSYSSELVSHIRYAWAEYKGGAESLAYLRSLGIIGYTARLIVEYFGGIINIRRVINDNVYDLLMVRGLGFKTVDELALGTFGYQQMDMRRVCSGMEYLLSEELNGNGNTWVTKQWFDYRVRKMFGGISDIVYEEGLIASRSKIGCEDDKVYLQRMYDVEFEVINTLRYLDALKNAEINEDEQ